MWAKNQNRYERKNEGETINNIIKSNIFENTLNKSRQSLKRLRNLKEARKNKIEKIQIKIKYKNYIQRTLNT